MVASGLKISLGICLCTIHLRGDVGFGEKEIEGEREREREVEGERESVREYLAL